ncbi:MAG: hypothetical protein HYR67_16365 [Bacteroidetes bacterium]|nr:hypothetical protein [Bacteroidota bacterium]
MKTLAQMIVLILMSSTLYGQDIKGQWNGVINIQGSDYRIVFHISKTDKQYKATLDSPDQNATGIPVTTVSLNNPNVKFEISNIGMVYEGILSDNSITGKWTQAGQAFPLVLLKTENLLDENNKKK